MDWHFLANLETFAAVDCMDQALGDIEILLQNLDDVLLVVVLVDDNQIAVAVGLFYDTNIILLKCIYTWNYEQNEDCSLVMTKNSIDYFFAIYQNIANIFFEKFQLILWHSLLRSNTTHILTND